MTLLNSNCVLCFKSLKNNLYSLETNNPTEHLKRVFDSCAKYLNSEIKGSSFRWLPHENQDNQTFCSICFHLADKLLQIDEQLDKLTKSLETHITLFTKEILKARDESPISNSYPGNDHQNFEVNIGCTADAGYNQENVTRICPEEEQEVANSDLRVKDEPIDDDDDFFSDGNEDIFNPNDFNLDEDHDVEIKKEKEDGISNRDRLPKRKTAVIAAEILNEVKAEPLFSGDEISESDEEYNENDREPLLSEVSEEGKDDADKDYKPGKSLAGNRTFSGSKNFKCSQCPLAFYQTKELDEHSAESGHVNEKNFKCLICDKSYYRNIDLKYHRRTHRDNDRSYTCGICQTVLKTYRGYKKHCKIHGEKFYNCTICMINFISKKDLTEHKKMHPVDELSCKECGKQFKYHLSLKYHLLSHEKKIPSKNWKKQKGFVCQNCPASFTLGRELEAHSLETGHVNEKNYSCSTCPKTYYRRLDLKYHMRKHNNAEKYKCELCDKTFSRGKHWRDHNRKHGIGKTFDCADCSKKFLSEKSLEDHVNTHTGATPYPCDSCDQEFASKSKLCRHKLSEHSERKTFNCTLCEMKLTTSTALAYHIFTHTGEKPFKCSAENCTSTFTTSKKLKLHVIRAHTDIAPSFECDICGKKYKLKEDMNKHRLRHPDKNRSFMCEECGKCYTSKTSLKGHQIKHSGHFFTCEICDNTYFSKQKLENHVNDVHMKNFICEVCGIRFESAKNLKVHKVTHKPEKIYSCQVCSKVFTRAKNLSVHKRIHDEVRKTFECDQCDQTYLSKRGLRMHKQIHAKGVEHKCHTCKKLFTDKQEFQEHIKAHQTADKPYHCKGCGTGFTRMDRLKVHSEKCKKIPTSSQVPQ